MKFNKLKWLFVAICFSIFNFPSFAQNNVCTVNGNISGITKETKISVSCVSVTGLQPIIANLKANGDFSFTLPATSFNELYDLKIEGVRNSARFIAEKGVVKITGDKSKLYAAAVAGTPENERWNNYQKFSQAQIAISNKMNMNAGKYTKEEVRISFNKLQADKKNYVDSLGKNYPKSIVSLYLAKEPLMMLKHDQIDSLLANFKPYFAKHPVFLAMKTRADILRKVANGAIAPNFTVMKPDGKTKISLASFRGKYVLLDFWASWCAPCRVENVHTKHLYERFSPAGLEIISFSLDSDLKAWQEALEKDGLVWHNASDLIGGKKSPVAQAYGIDGIPAIWLIDPNGKIIADNLKREALEKLLETIFVNPKS